MNTITKETNSKPPPPGTPGPFSLSDENSLKNSFIMSGFKDLSIERMKVSFDFDSADAYTTFISEIIGTRKSTRFLEHGIWGTLVSVFIVSEDSRLRQTIRREAMKESQQFLDAIGTAEMGQEVERRVIRTKDLMEQDKHLGRVILNVTFKRY